MKQIPVSPDHAPMFTGPRRSWDGLLLFACAGVAVLGWIVASRLETANDVAGTVHAGVMVPDFSLNDVDGVPRTLASYRGRPLILIFGFTWCPEACPVELHTLASAMRQLGAAADRVQVALVTLDPDRDSPAVLKRYVTAFDPRFTGLTGSQAQIDAAARRFSVVYERVAVGGGYTIDHSMGFYLVDGTGRYRGLLPGHSPASALADAIRRLDHRDGERS